MWFSRTKPNFFCGLFNVLKEINTLGILHSHRDTHQKSMKKQVCTNYSSGTSIILLQYVFQFQNKEARLNRSVK